jgi:DNA adenine methylase
LKKPINVASVPMRSPFRYPGGKTWFVPYVRKWLRKLGGNLELIEPFAGGGIVSLTAALENLAKKVIMVEKDEDVAAVWRTILGQEGKWLAEQITSIEITPENVRAVLKKHATSVRQRAFITILKNRLHHGGILAYGAGFIKNGENGKGLRSRWYPGTLKKRIMAITEIRSKIEFIQGDGLEVIEKNLEHKDAAFFIDPPYTRAGRRLYKYHEINHKRLFDLAKNISGDLLITYDDAPEIEALARKQHFEVEKVLMKTTHHTKKYELVIGWDLGWLRRMQEL